MIQSLKAKDERRLSSIRLLQAAVQRREVDERTTLDDGQIIIITEKLIKQSKEAITQFEKAERADLVTKEQQDITVWQQYLPEQMADEEVEKIITDAVAETGASSIKDMGRVMALVKAKIQGRADMGTTSAKIKTILSSN